MGNESNYTMLKCDASKGQNRLAQRVQKKKKKTDAAREQQERTSLHYKQYVFKVGRRRRRDAMQMNIYGRVICK